ncbi:MAG: ArsC/Spx/MgsR family protein [Shimia sp.]
MRLYGLKTCDTCRKAAKALPEAQIVDVRAEGVPPDVLDRAEAAFGAALVNRRSTTWRGLDAATREMPAAQLIAAHPSVMKRPLIVEGDRMSLGWDGAARAVWGL